MTGTPREDPLRVGIVGCGNIAGNHVAAFRTTPGVEIAACCDVDAERATRFAARYGIPASVAGVGGAARRQRGRRQCLPAAPDPGGRSDGRRGARLGMKADGSVLQVEAQVQRQVVSDG